MEAEDFSALDLEWGCCNTGLNLSWISLTDVGLVGGQVSGGDGSALEPVEDEALAKEMSAMGLPSSFSTKKQVHRKRKGKKPTVISGGSHVDNVDKQRNIDCWYQAYDMGYSCHYYYNCALGITQWEVPEQPYIPLNASSNHSECEIPERGKQESGLEGDAHCEQESIQGVSCGEMGISGMEERTNYDDNLSTRSEESSAHKEPNLVSLTDVSSTSAIIDNATAAQVRSSMPRQVFKYWLQRYSLFSKYDSGIQLDTPGWFSATPECLASHQAQRCRSSVVIDAFTGVGGNAIQFAKYCDRVIAIDTSYRRLEMAKKNAEIYGQASKIDFICGDFFQVGPTLKADVVFISPPWGGPCYRESNTTMIDQSSELGQYVYQAISISKSIVKEGFKGSANGVVVFLPKNSHLPSVSSLVSGHEAYEIEVAALNGYVKALTAYFGKF